jgi:hypothetical protein
MHPALDRTRAAALNISVFQGDPRQGAEKPLAHPSYRGRAARKSFEPDPVRTGVGIGDHAFHHIGELSTRRVEVF